MNRRGPVGLLCCGLLAVSIAGCSSGVVGAGEAVSVVSSHVAPSAPTSSTSHATSTSASPAGNAGARTSIATTSVAKSTSASAAPSASVAPKPSSLATPLPLLPDLSVQGMTIVQDSTTHARVTFDVHNIGAVDVTQPYFVFVCISALCVEKQTTLPVRASDATEVFVDFNHPSSKTPETVTVTVDSRNEIRELREDNNSTTLNDVSLDF